MEGVEGKADRVSEERWCGCLIWPPIRAVETRVGRGCGDRVDEGDQFALEPGDDAVVAGVLYVGQRAREK